MKRAQAKSADLGHELVCGLFTKKEAAQLIANGTQHLHSIVKGKVDLCADITRENIDRNLLNAYPWEKPHEATKNFLSSSKDRYKIIEEIIHGSKVPAKREMRERVHSVLEELLTNAIFHGYRNQKGVRRFPRGNSATLTDLEKIEIRYSASTEGVYLAVTDRAGSLILDDLSKSLSRCYAGSANQIETKESGAGLGMYMVFEATTHIKIVSEPKRQCTVSCWLADKVFFDPNDFSFNFYLRR